MLRGSERRNHKYIARNFKNGRWYYIYPTTGRKTSKIVKNKSESYDDVDSVLGVSHVKSNLYSKISGGSHRFGPASPIDIAAYKARDEAIKQYKHRKIEKRQKKEKRLEAMRKAGPDNVLGSAHANANKYYKLYNHGGHHNF